MGSGASNATLLRVVSAVFGVIAAVIAIVVPFSFVAITMSEIESAKQYQVSLPIIPSESSKAAARRKRRIQIDLCVCDVV